MTNTDFSKKVTCEGCGADLTSQESDSSCISCGSSSKKITLIVEETVNIESHDNLRSRTKDDSLTGKRKLRKDIFAGDDLFKTAKRWVKKIRIIDKDRDYYHEKVWDETTGEVFREVEEKLSDHLNRGSAKPKEKDKG